jgi:hypothetical protein
MLMLQALQDRVSERKLRLFGAACCRRFWDQTWHERSRQMIELIERFADGQATAGEIERVAEEAEAANGDDRDPGFAGTAAWVLSGEDARTAAEISDPGFAGTAVWVLSGEDARNAAEIIEQVTTGWATELAADSEDSEEAAEQQERAAHVALLHDIFDDTFRLPAFDPIRLASHNSVQELASLIYEERLFEHMPLLGDALEAAGCADEDVLSHCRSEAEHARGCWVVDAILGKS